MSETVLRLVPDDPAFKPTESAAGEAEEYVHALVPDADEITSRYFHEVTFVDAGANWSGVACPYCRADIDIWWPDAMSRAYESKFRNLGIITPCCGKSGSLNELDYGWPVAFGSYILEIREPGIPFLEFGQVEKIGEALGCDVTQVVAHI